VDLEKAVRNINWTLGIRRLRHEDRVLIFESNQRVCEGKSLPDVKEALGL